MRIDVDSADGYPSQVRVMTDDGYWTTFWRASDCQARAFQAAKDARDLAEERRDEMIEALHNYAIGDDEQVMAESLHARGLGSDLIAEIIRRYPQGSDG